jgi:hypothetical protein
MRRTTGFLLTLLVLLATGTRAAWTVYPVERILTDKGATWPLSDSLQIVIGSHASPSDSLAAYLLSKDVELFSKHLPAVVREYQARRAAGQRIVMGRLGRDTLLSRLCTEKGIAYNASVQLADSFGYKRQEGYELDCGTDVLLAAPSDDGVFYGSRSTIFQHLDTLSGGTLHQVRASDWPDLSIRGYYLANATAPYRPAHVKRMIRLWSRLKLNTVLLELFGDMNMLKCVNLPLGSENPRAWTPAELADVIQYAKQFHVEIIPVVELFHYCKALLYFYPDLGIYNAYGNTATMSHTMDPADPRVYWLAEDILNEFWGYVQSGRVHMSLDEEESIYWPSIPKIQGIFDRLNAKYNKNIRMMYWHDGPATPDSLRGKIDISPWDYAAIPVNKSTSYALDKFFTNGQQKAIVGGAGSSGVYNNSWQWIYREKGNPNFIGYFPTIWSYNGIDGYELTWLSGAAFSWNWDTDTTIGSKWNNFFTRFPEMRRSGTNTVPIFLDPFLAPQDSFKYSFWNPTNPAQNEPDGYIKSGYFQLSGLPVAPSVDWSKDTLAMHVVPDPAGLPLMAVEARADVIPVSLECFPNPFSRMARIRITGYQVSGKAVLTVYTLQGKKVAVVETSAASLRGGVNLDTGGFPSGVYLAKVLAGTKEVVRRVICLR